MTMNGRHNSETTAVSSWQWSCQLATTWVDVRYSAHSTGAAGPNTLQTQAVLRGMSKQHLIDCILMFHHKHIRARIFIVIVHGKSLVQHHLSHLTSVTAHATSWLFLQYITRIVPPEEADPPAFSQRPYRLHSTILTARGDRSSSLPQRPYRLHSITPTSRGG